MNPDALHRALTESVPMRPLPDDVVAMLVEIQAPPRLAAHLRAVHDTAAQLATAIEALFPALTCDWDEVLFGAATHDIGKAIHVGELSGPGSEHEAAGQELLLGRGIDARLARFASNHAMWTAPGMSTEDLMVSLADRVWKGKRVQALEDLVVARLCEATGQSPWEVFMALDDVLGRLAEDAGERLAYQARHLVGAAPEGEG